MWDIFISHAWEDKESVARPLADALKNLGFKVWFDEYSLTLGDSLRRSIDKGLSESRFGVVILSPSFFNKEWTQRELDGLTAREISSGKIILPVWHDVTRREIEKFSPVLADRIGISTAKGLEAVINEVLKVISVDSNNAEQNLAPAEEQINRVKRQHGPKFDWGAAPMVDSFFGRKTELRKLEKWILVDKCRIVTLVGMKGIGKTNLSIRLGKGGIGKTDLSLKLARGIQEKFEYVIWRRLLHEPYPRDVLLEIIKFVSDQKEIDLPETLDETIARLVFYMKKHRVLLILDNYEAVIDTGMRGFGYKPGYEGYGEILNKVGTSDHQSCLLITSREKPLQITNLDGVNKLVRTLQLGGLGVKDGIKIFEEIGRFKGSTSDWRQLIKFYDGNPLALELVARHIQDVFFGDINAFLMQGQPIIPEMKDLLEWHFERLPSSEKEVVYWFAINREPVDYETIRDDLVSNKAKENLPATLQSLQRHIPVEKSKPNFSIQPVLMEYVTGRLIEQIGEGFKLDDELLHSATTNMKQEFVDDLLDTGLQIFNSHALIKATSKEYVKDIQRRLILRPVLNEVLGILGGNERFIEYMQEMLKGFHGDSLVKHGYALGNMINLLCELNIDLSKFDYSNMPIWQADLQNYNLHDVNFQNAEFKNTIFCDKFGIILSMALSPESDTLYVGTGEGDIRIWNTKTWKETGKLLGHTDWVRTVSISPDGQYLASGSHDREVRIWDVKTGICIKKLLGHDGWIWSTAFSPDGKQLASASYDKTIRLWDTSSWETEGILTGHHGAIWSIAYSSDGKYIASGSIDTTIKLWDPNKLNCLATLSGHTNWVTAVAFHKTKPILASGGSDNNILIWDVEKREIIHELNGHTNRIWYLCFNPDGSRLASSSNDQTVRLWDYQNGICLNTLQGHTNQVRPVLFIPNTNLIVSGGDDQAIKLWDKENGYCIKTIKGFSNWYMSLDFSPDAKKLVAGSHSKAIHMWNSATGEPIRSFYGHKNWVMAVVFRSDGKQLASGSYDHKIKIWDVEKGDCTLTLSGHTDEVASIAYHTNGDYLASGSYDKTIRIWDLKNGQCVKIFRGHTNRVWSVVFSPDGKKLVSSSDDFTIRIWDFDTGECKKVVNDHQANVWSVAYSADGQLIASGSDDRTVRVWRTDTMECVHIFEGHKSLVRCVRFSPNGNKLISGSADGSLRLWDLNNGECIKIFNNHLGWIWSVAFSPDGNTIASGGDDEKVNLWDANTLQLIHTFQIDPPYARMNISGALGLTDSQISTLTTLGAIAHDISLEKKS